MRFRFSPVFLSALFVFTQASMAEEALSPQKSERQIKKPAPPADKKEAPTVITADKVEAKQSHVLEATGKAEIRKGDQLIQADHFLYLQDILAFYHDNAVFRFLSLCLKNEEKRECKEDEKQGFHYQLFGFYWSRYFHAGTAFTYFPFISKESS